MKKRVLAGRIIIIQLKKKKWLRYGLNWFKGQPCWNKITFTKANSLLVSHFRMFWCLMKYFITRRQQQGVTTADRKSQWTEHWFKRHCIMFSSYNCEVDLTWFGANNFRTLHFIFPLAKRMFSKHLGSVSLHFKCCFINE